MAFRSGGRFSQAFVSGEWGDPGRLLDTSDSEATWDDADPPELTGMYSLAYGNGKLVSAGWVRWNLLVNERSELDRARRRQLAINFRSIAFGVSNFVAVGDLNGNFADVSAPSLFVGGWETWPFRTRDWRLTSPRLSTAQTFRSRGRTNLPLNDRDYDLESHHSACLCLRRKLRQGRYVAIGTGPEQFWF